MTPTDYSPMGVPYLAWPDRTMPGLAMPGLAPPSKLDHDACVTTTGNETTIITNFIFASRS